MKLKYAALILASTTLLGTSAAYAKSETFSDAEVQALFEGGNPSMQVAALSSQEMKETEGAFGPIGAFVGGVGGLTEYALENYISGSEWSWTSAASMAGGGAIAGATAGPVALIWGFNGALAGGTLRGIAQRHGW